MTHSRNPRVVSLQKAIAITALILVAGSVSSSRAALVGGKFLGRGADGGPGLGLAPSESAGAVAQTHWNSIDSGSTYKGTSASMTDDSGNFTAVRIIYDCSDSWNSDGGNTTPDERLMKGIIKANPEPDTAPANNTGRVLFTITNLAPSTAYNVIVYTIENGAGAKMDLTCGATTYYIAEENVFAGSYDLASSTTPGNYIGANYAEFDGVTSTASGTIVVTGTKLIEVDGNGNQITDGVGIAAIQVVRT